MTCQDEHAAYKEAENALVGAVLERQQARDDLAAAEAALADAQSVKDNAEASVASAQSSVEEKAATANAAHDAWMQCVTNN